MRITADTQRLGLSRWIQRRSVVRWQLSLCQQNAIFNQDSPGRLQSALTELLPLFTFTSAEGVRDKDKWAVWVWNYWCMKLACWCFIWHNGMLDMNRWILKKRDNVFFFQTLLALQIVLSYPLIVLINHQFCLEEENNFFLSVFGDFFLSLSAVHSTCAA